MHYRNGDVYDGEWENDQHHGLGKLTTEYFVYDGSWKEGMKDGRGELRYKLENISYVGDFSDDKFCGMGVFCNDSIRFQGKFKNNNKVCVIN